MQWLFQKARELQFAYALANTVGVAPIQGVVDTLNSDCGSAHPEIVKSIEVGIAAYAVRAIGHVAPCNT